MTVATTVVVAPMPLSQVEDSTWLSLLGVEASELTRLEYTTIISTDGLSTSDWNMPENWYTIHTYYDDTNFKTWSSPSLQTTDWAGVAGENWGSLLYTANFVDSQTNGLRITEGAKKLHMKKQFFSVVEFSELLRTSIPRFINADESLSIVEVLRKILPDIELIENLALASSASTAGSQFIEFLSSIGISDEAIHSPGLYFSEVIKLLDDYSNGYTGTLSDIELSSDPIDSISEFEDRLLNGRVPGYSEFRSYIQGDYKYTKALVKATLESFEANTRVELRELKAEVDLPDIIDRGVQFYDPAVPATSTINFNYTFDEAPQLSVVVVGGLAGAANYKIEVVALTTTYADIILKDTGNAGALIAGTVNWTAHGY